MLFECVGKTLGQIVLKFPPLSEDNVDTLLYLDYLVPVYYLSVLVK